MEQVQQQGPFCQRCGMPLVKPEDFGSARGGMRINDYCQYCFREGAFVTPDITKQQMIELCVKMMAERGVMPETQARAMMTEVIPQLKRWRSAA